MTNFRICLFLGMISAAPTFASLSFTCDPSIGSDFKAGVCSYLNTTTAALYNDTFSNINANIYITATNSGLGMSNTGSYNLVSYAVYQAALEAVSTDAAKAFVPASEPSIFGSGDVEITSALASALGITNAAHSNGGTPSGIGGVASDGSPCTGIGSGCYNGIVYINDPTDLSAASGGQGYTYESLGGSTNGSTENYDFFAVVEHEVDEVLGSSSCIGLTGVVTQNGCFNNPAAVDLFRYSAPAVRAYSSTSPTNQYFSADGGLTDLQGNLYNTTTPNEDWADFSQGCVFIQDAEGCPSTNPATNSYSILTDGPGGTVGPEIAILNAVGYNLEVAPEPGTLGLLGFGVLALGVAARRRRA